MTRARGIMGKFSTGIRGAITTVTRFVGPLAALGTAAVSATMGVRGLVNAFRDLDSLAKSSDRLGVAVQDLQALNLAAELGGTSTQVMEKGLATMLRRASEARLGLAQARRSFDQLGISADDFARLDAADQFELIAERLTMVEQQTERARIAQDIFGRSGIELLNILQDGGATIRGATADIERFGLALTRTDLRRIEEANDSMTRMRHIVGGLFNVIAVQLAPTVTALTNQFLNAGEAGVGFVESVTPMIDLLNGALARTLTTTERVAAGFKIVGQGVANMELQIATMMGDFESVERISGEIANRWKEIDRTLGQTAGQRFLSDVEAARKRAEESLNRIRNLGDGTGGAGAAASLRNQNAALLQGSEQAFQAIVERQIRNADSRERGTEAAIRDMDERNAELLEEINRAIEAGLSPLADLGTV